MKVEAVFKDCGVRIYGSATRDIDELDTARIKELFKENGLVLFSDFDIDVEKFEDFSNRFSNDYMDHTGGGALRKVINEKSDRTILSVAYSYDKSTASFEETKQRTFPLALHSDRSYTTSQPPLMWFYCKVPARERGQTIVCDGVTLFQSLSAETQEFLHNNEIDYIRTYPDGEWQLMVATDSLDDLQTYCDENDLELTVNADNSITTHSIRKLAVKPRWSDQFAFVNSILLVMWQEDVAGEKRSIVRMRDGSKIPADILAEIKRVSEDLTREINWLPGELVMIDNTRILHGRRAFEDQNREIYVRMSRSVDW